MKTQKFAKILIFIIFFLLIGPRILTVLAEFEKENQEIKSLSSGDYLRFITSGGRIRSYFIHIPPSYNGEEPVPLVFFLHGNGFPNTNARRIKNLMNLDEKADEEGFITVYPNGKFVSLGELEPPFMFLIKLFMVITNSRMWNCWDMSKVDDVDFFRDLINHLKIKHNINSSRIYVSGVSGGGCMSYRLGSELSDLIAAIAPIVGTSGGTWFVPAPDDSKEPFVCPEPENSVPVIAFNGLLDEKVTYEGGWLHVFNIGFCEAWTYFLSVNESIDLWVDYNNCNPAPQIYETESGRTIFRNYTAGCDNSEVILVTYVDGGHHLFISPNYEFSSTELMWEFFEKHPKKNV